MYHCDITGTLCGTGTFKRGETCDCATCREWRSEPTENWYRSFYDSGVPSAEEED